MRKFLPTGLRRVQIPKEENFWRELYDPVLCRSMAYIHSSSSSLLSADRDGGNLQRQLMGGAVGPTIFNCWWWEGVSWSSRWRIPNECCKSLGLPFIKIQLVCSAAGAAVVISSGRLLCSVGRCFKWQREALSLKLSKSGCWGVTPIKTLRPSTSALVVEFNSRFNEKLRRNRNSWRCDGKLWHFQLS